MELTRLVCMAGIVLLSLVLPLTAGARTGRHTATVLRGQLLGAVGGVFALIPAFHPAFGLAIALFAVAYFRQQLRRVPSAATVAVRK